MLLKPTSKTPLQATDLVRRNIRLELQYDGTQYHGWQIQSNLKTIQGELTKILRTITQDSIKLSGSGRTDARLLRHCRFVVEWSGQLYQQNKSPRPSIPSFDFHDEFGGDCYTSSNISAH